MTLTKTFNLNEPIPTDIANWVNQIVTTPGDPMVVVTLRVERRLGERTTIIATLKVAPEWVLRADPPALTLLGDVADVFAGFELMKQPPPRHSI